MDPSAFDTLDSLDRHPCVPPPVAGADGGGVAARGRTRRPAAAEEAAPIRWGATRSGATTGAATTRTTTAVVAPEGRKTTAASARRGKSAADSTVARRPTAAVAAVASVAARGKSAAVPTVAVAGVAVATVAARGKSAAGRCARIPVRARPEVDQQAPAPAGSAVAATGATAAPAHGVAAWRSSRCPDAESYVERRSDGRAAMSTLFTATRSIPAADDRAAAGIPGNAASRLSSAFDRATISHGWCVGVDRGHSAAIDYGQTDAVRRRLRQRAGRLGDAGP